MIRLLGNLWMEKYFFRAKLIEMRWQCDDGVPSDLPHVPSNVCRWDFTFVNCKYQCVNSNFMYDTNRTRKSLLLIKCRNSLFLLSSSAFYVWTCVVYARLVQCIDICNFKWKIPFCKSSIDQFYCHRYEHMVASGCSGEPSSARL